MFFSVTRRCRGNGQPERARRPWRRTSVQACRRCCVNSLNRTPCFRRPQHNGHRAMKWPSFFLQDSREGARYTARSSARSFCARARLSPRRAPACWSTGAAARWSGPGGRLAPLQSAVPPLRGASARDCPSAQRRLRSARGPRCACTAGGRRSGGTGRHDEPTRTSGFGVTLRQAAHRQPAAFTLVHYSPRHYGRERNNYTPNCNCSAGSTVGVRDGCSLTARISRRNRLRAGDAVRQPARRTRSRTVADSASCSFLGR